jgi:formylglycine-generating enzyme
MNLNNRGSQTFTKRSTKFWLIIAGFLIGLIFLKSGKAVVNYTSSDKYCVSCHIHPMADQSWKLSAHYNNRTGNIVHCVDCHLPPEGPGYLFAKAKHGFKDVYGYFFKDSAKINWEEKKLPEIARTFVYEKSCKECHQNLFPVKLSLDGGNAHLLYTTSKEPLSCINCHLNVGHFDKNALHAHNTSFGVNVTVNQANYTEPARVEKFENFKEKIPGSNVSFDMVAIPAGQFRMGSPDNEPLRKKDEGPLRKVSLSKFWIGKTEVTWDEYMAFFRATGSQGRTEGQVVTNKNVDAISGATPPWGAPDQGWGKGSRPAITMTWHAADVYCKWLSKVTGKKYRLPTEAEWEYACRGGTETPYFFAGNPKKFTSSGLLKKIFGSDTALIASRVVYKVNSNSKTKEPQSVLANPFGLKNMLGNVAEFCLDFYSSDTYKADSTLALNPGGPASGQEHVIRGGSFKSDASDVRCASRDFTKTKAWLVTDPQMPKSIWWYSDCIDVGFRVVCEADSIPGNK